MDQVDYAHISGRSSNLCQRKLSSTPNFDIILMRIFNDNDIKIITMIRKRGKIGKCTLNIFMFDNEIYSCIFDITYII